MKKIMDILRGIVFLIAGALLLLTPYAKVKAIFPNAPAPIIVKIMGGIVLLCGILIAVLYAIA